MKTKNGTASSKTQTRAPRRDGSLREQRLDCCLALEQWSEAADLADALLHDGLKPGAVARFHCAFARHRLDAGDPSRALWELGIAIQTHDATRAAILEDEVLHAMLFE